LILMMIIFLFLKKKSSLPPVTPTPTPIIKKYDYTPVTKEICSKIKEKHKREICFDEIWVRKAVSEKDIRKCTKIKRKGRRDDCVLHLASDIYKNIDFCYAISDPGKRSKCIDGVIIKTRDIKLCKKIFKGEPFEIEECENRVLAFEISESPKKEDILKCKELKVLEYPNLCYIYSFKNKFNNNCREVPPELRDLCDAVLIANYGKDRSMCDHIKVPQYRDYCHLRFEIGGGDIRAAEMYDSDGDGVCDGDEIFYRTDLHNFDTDEDKLTDGEEIFTYGTNPIEKDTDNDGLDDYQEVKIYHTSPNKFDSDNDGVLDGEEVKKGDDPMSGDKDRDGLLDELEMRIGTNPAIYDTDGDGIKDGEEWENGTDPLKKGTPLADTDKDGLLDVDEIFYGTDRLNPDTDGDGVPDKKEVEELTNPLGEGDMDFDGDGLTDKEEVKYGTNPSLPDTDGDGISDFEEVKGKKIKK